MTSGDIVFPSFPLIIARKKIYRGTSPRARKSIKMGMWVGVTHEILNETKLLLLFWFCLFVCFCFVLFCFVLFCFVFVFVLFCFVLFSLVLFVLFCFALFCFVFLSHLFYILLFIRRNLYHRSGENRMFLQNLRYKHISTFFSSFLPF